MDNENEAKKKTNQMGYLSCTSYVIGSFISFMKFGFLWSRTDLKALSPTCGIGYGGWEAAEYRLPRPLVQLETGHSSSPMAHGSFHKTKSLSTFPEGRRGRGTVFTDRRVGSAPPPCQAYELLLHGS